jgi:ABC-type lipoprotein export system ATPase subunit
MKLLTELNKVHKKTILMVTHDLEYLKYAITAVKMFNGSIVGVYEKEDQRELINEIRSKRGKDIKSQV